MALLLALVFGLAFSDAQAREIDSFVVRDGQGTYAFDLVETGMALYFYSYQHPDYAEMGSRVSVFRSIGPAPQDDPAIRAEIAEKVRWLYVNEMARLDTENPVDLPHGIVCYPAVLNADGTSNSGVGLRFVVEGGVIRRVEAAMSSPCALAKANIEAYEAQKPGR
jgi:hypothetical protein